MSEEMILSLLTAVCVLALAVVSRWVSARPIDLVTQFAPIWIYCTYLATRQQKAARSRRRVWFWSLLILAITAAVALVHLA